MCAIHLLIMMLVGFSMLVSLTDEEAGPRALT